MDIYDVTPQELVAKINAAQDGDDIIDGIRLRYSAEDGWYLANAERESGYCGLDEAEQATLMMWADEDGKIGKAKA